MAVQHNIMKGLCCGYTYQQLATNSFHRVIHMTAFATLEAFVPDLMDWFVMAHLVMIGPADHMQHGKCQSYPTSILQRLGAPVVKWKVYQQVRKSLLAKTRTYYHTMMIVPNHLGIRCTPAPATCSFTAPFTVLVGTCSRFACAAICTQNTTCLAGTSPGK